MTVFCFDGTGNHRNFVRPDGRIRRVDAGLGTNVAKLSAIIDEKVIYVGGVANPIDCPFWSQASEATLAMACKDLVEQTWPAVEEVLVDGDGIIDMIGFGRGAMQAVELINRIADRNAELGTRHGVRFCCLLDPIWAAGLPGNHRDQVIRHELPDGLHIDTFIEAIAWDEARLQFQCHWQDLERPGLEIGRAEQEIFRGVHRDVGGGYAVTGLSDIVLRWAVEWAGQAGIALVDEPAWSICGERLVLRPDAAQLPHRVTDIDYFPKPRRFPARLIAQARAHHFPLGAWHRVIVRNRGQREKYLMNLDPFIEDSPRKAGFREVDPRSWFPKRPRPDAKMQIERALSDADILQLMQHDAEIG